VVVPILPTPKTHLSRISYGTHVFPSGVRAAKFTPENK